MLIRRLFKNRGLAINLFACLSFLALAVYGWGLPWKTLLTYLFISLACLAILVGAALLAGYVLHRIKNRKKNDM